MDTANRIQGHSGQESTQACMTAKASEYYEATKESFQEHPLAAAVTAFGVGVGVGAFLAMTLGGSGRRIDHSAESVARRVMSSIQDYLPDMLKG